MFKPHIVRSVALGALLLGIGFLAANIYFDGPGHRSLAKMFFIFAVLCEFIFATTTILWVYCSAWVREPQRSGPMPGAPMPGAPMPGAPMPGAPMPGPPTAGAPMPGITIDGNPRPPQS